MGIIEGTTILGVIKGDTRRLSSDHSSFRGVGVDDVEGLGLKGLRM